MGGSASRIWNDICAIESDQVRAAMIERVVQSPELRSAAQQYGVYETVVQWLMARRHGRQMPWPYQYKTVATAATPTAAVQDPRLAMWQIPTATTATASTTSMIVSPAAKAMDYFQEALELLGIHDSEELTAELLKTAYRRVALRVHPDKAGGSKEAFDAVKQAYDYVLRILQRINPRFSPAEEARMTGPVTAETAAAYRSATAPPALPDTPPVALSAKKLDMGVFNRLFEENRLPDPSRDTGYGDWMKEDNKVPAAAAAAAAAKKSGSFEERFKAVAVAQTAGTALVRRTVPESLVSLGGTVIGEDPRNFTAPLGADTQFTDIKEAYTHGSTVYQEVAGVKIDSRQGVGSADVIKRQRDAALARPIEASEHERWSAAAVEAAEMERARRLRTAQMDAASDSWADMMRRRMLVNS